MTRTEKRTVASIPGGQLTANTSGFLSHVPIGTSKEDEKDRRGRHQEGRKRERRRGEDKREKRRGPILFSKPY